MKTCLYTDVEKRLPNTKTQNIKIEPMFCLGFRQ